MSEVQRRILHIENGPRYGVNAFFGPASSGPVFAWFSYAPDAFAYAEPMKLAVWDLVVGRRIERPDETDSRPPPEIRYDRAACPGCGARTVDEAGARCRPTTDETGEWSCPGGDREDPEGYILQPRPDDLKRFDAWIDSQKDGEGGR